MSDGHEPEFEYFICPAYVGEDWGPHSFTELDEFHCRCGGGPFWEEESEEAQ